MSLNLEKSYIDNLIKYVGKDFKIFEYENRIEIMQEYEIKYILENDLNSIYRFSCVERGESLEIEKYFSEQEMKRKFAITINGLIGQKIDYKNGEKFEEAKSITEVEKLMDLYVGKEYYSIMNAQKMKINLEKNGENEYSIYLLGENGEKQYKEKKLDAPFMFFRFYSEALFFKDSIERIDKYQLLFNDILNSQEKYDLIAY
ncbi:hypothetical protein UT300007_26980 [Clostridium sp. CTA-7]